MVNKSHYELQNDFRLLEERKQNHEPHLRTPNGKVMKNRATQNLKKEQILANQKELDIKCKI